MSKAAIETKKFATETKQIMELFAKWLYRDRDIFLRELISNAADAQDKLKTLALADDSLYADDHDLKIWILIDKDKKTITVRDNGVGMDYDEVVSHLGTIARSGTKQFLQSMAATDGTVDKGNLIGQFGVGFYSAFVVADEVEVRSLRAGLKAEEGVVWRSNGHEDYQIAKTKLDNRGTEVVLHLKEDAADFLEQWRLRKIITTYSDHIGFPIVMFKEQEIADESAADEGEKDKDKDAPKKTEIVEEVVNQAKALWTMPKKDITDEQYEAFYKHISHDFNKPIAWVHNRVEGKLEYTSLLYIPSQAPFDLWNRDHKRGLKLYVQRVFIMDDAEQLLPAYLRFVKGVIDANDLPLNVSREVLQSSEVVETIKASCIKRILGTLEAMIKDDPEKYHAFWKTFGAVLKEGPGEDFANKDRIAKLLRFSSTANDSELQTRSLDDYVAAMLKDQDKIYYIIAENYSAAKASPHLELFKKRGVEVLLLTERIDEWLVSRLGEYAGKSLVSISRGDVDLGDLGSSDEEKQEYEKQKEAFADITKRVKDVLADKVKDVRVTERLTDSPSCVVADDDDMSMNLKRMLKEAGQAVPDSKPILELNPNHALVERLKNEVSDEQFARVAEVLLGQAVLAEGGSLQNPAEFVNKLNQLLLS